MTLAQVGLLVGAWSGLCIDFEDNCKRQANKQPSLGIWALPVRMIALSVLGVWIGGALDDVVDRLSKKK